MNRTTILIVISSIVLVVLALSPATRNMFPLWIIASAAGVGDTMFHEMGHSITGWLLGVPNVPSILTVFGRDQAAGLTMQFGYFWLLQIAAIAGLIYLTYDMYQSAGRWFYPILTLTIIITLIAISGYYQTAISYMGHGGAILTGAFFLYRFWNGMAMVVYERWLSAFFGFYIVLHNAYFAYQLIYDADYKEAYSDHTIGSIGHNDFQQMSEQITSWSVHEIAVFTLMFAVLMLLISFVAGVYKSITTEEI